MPPRPGKAPLKPLSVLPGMTATVEIRTGQRSVLGFVLRPMLKTSEAFRER
jgi:adhesin transport system membrane fusion protein